MRTTLLALLVAGLAATGFSAGAAEGGPALGLMLESKGHARPAMMPDLDPGQSVRVRLKADWAEVERQPSLYDWSSVASDISFLKDEGYSIVLSLSGSNPLYMPEDLLPSAYEEGAISSWNGFVRSAVRSFAGDVDVIEIWDRAEGLDPAGYAFMLKNSALAARAEAEAMSSSVLIAQAPVSPAALDWQMALWSFDSAAYIDILPLILDVGSDLALAEEQISRFRNESLMHPPAATLWAYVPDAKEGEPWEPPALALLGLGAGAEAALVGCGASGDRAAWLVGTDRILAAGYAPSPPGDLDFLDENGDRPEGAMAIGRFFSNEDFSTVIFYRLPGAADELPIDRMVVDTRHVRNSRVVDPASGRLVRVSSAPLPEDEGARAIRIAGGELPLALMFEKGISTEGFDLPPEEVEAESSRELTAEEIIARHQQVQEVQEDLLERWAAAARIDFHFKFAQAGATVDISIDSNYFWERDGQVEWEQTDYYINGNRVRWKNIPELPFLQPEKVLTLPLDLTMDKTYRYRSVGRARVAGRNAYVLEFQPADPGSSKSLYRGKIWIDSLTFVRLKASIVQTNLDAPVLANEERDHYREVKGPRGEDLWLLDRINGQQVWTAGGRNFVVEREVTFFSYDINPAVAEFERKRDAAYASDNQMLRDTDDGFRYLMRGPDGGREVKEEIDSSQLFAAAGAFKDSSSDSVLPLAGVNYFDYDVAGKNIQLNVLFGGLLAFVTATKPDLFGTKIDATIDVTGIGFKADDKYYQGEIELTAERIRRRAQYLSGRLGFPAGPFFKFSLVGGYSWQTYDHDGDVISDFDLARERDPEDGPIDLEFILPPDHTLLSAGLLAEFNRRGYSLSVGITRARRSEWAEWGLVENLEGGDQQFCRADNELTLCDPTEPEPVFESFNKWNVSAFKEWRLPKFQKINAEIDYLDSSDLDRFSQYRFGIFGSSGLSGYSGSGVRFDSGAILRTAYSFNLFEAIRFSASLESALVERDATAEGRRSFTGVGLSGNFVGPWKTVINASTGYALASDIPGLEGEIEFMVMVFKLF